ncbi:membrane frizzled-related protein [Clarias gariepinus]
MVDSEKTLYDPDLYKNVFCNPAFEPDNEHDEIKEVCKVAISSEPVNSCTIRGSIMFGLCVGCVRRPWCNWGALVFIASLLLLLAVLGLTLALALTHIKDLAEGRMLSLNSLTENSIQEGLVPKPTIPLHEYSSPMPHLVHKPIPYTKCGGILTESEGTFSSPNHPGPYPADSMCVWVIRMSPPSLVQLHISSLAIEGPVPCLFDWLELGEEGEHTNTVTRFCGNVAPPTVNTNTSTLWVSFLSDSSIGGNGFIAQYKAILPWQKSCSVEEFMCDSGRCLLPVSVCDRQLNCQDQTDEANCSHKHRDCGGEKTGPNGSLSSPNHPKPYPHQQRCTWHISADKGQVIQLSFHNFSLETQDVCEFDYVEVHDSINTGDSSVLGRFCGSDLPPDLTSTGPVMSVVFVADDGVADTGFYASYQVISLLERGCSPEQFACSTGECLHHDWLCDGWNDCMDGADEENCSSSTYPPYTPSCEPIQVEMCQGLSYNLTSFPNIWLSIADQREAAYMLRQYRVLMELDCFKPLRQLVCALFVPQCSVKGGVLQPCSSVCSVAQQQCARDLELFSLSWPFNCHLLSDSQDPMQCSMP